MGIKKLINNNKIFVGLSLSYLLLQLTLWPPLFFWGWWGGGNFLDSWQVLVAADCYRNIGLEVYQIDNTCMVYVYGRPLLMLLAQAHLGASQAAAIGLLFLIGVSAVLATSFKNTNFNSFSKQAIIPLLAFSPPIMLLVERGNIDALQVCLVIGAAMCVGKGRTTLGIIAIFISSVIKFYTFPILLLLVITVPKKREKFLSITLAVVAAFSIFRDLKIIEFQFNPLSPRITFGMGHEFLFLLKYDRFDWLVHYYKYLGAILFIACALVLFIWLKNKNIDLKWHEVPSFVSNTYLYTTLVSIVCYLSGSSVDYRLIFLLLSALTFSQLITSSEKHFQFVIPTMLGILWLSFPSGDLEIIGDFLITAYLAFQTALSMRLLRKRIPSKILNKDTET